MKTITKLMAISVSVLALNAQANLYTYSWSSGFDAGSGLIPDGNVAGWSDTRSFTTGDFTYLGNSSTEIVDVKVRLEITGGYNGDLYGYLVHSSGFAVLLNRVGVGGTDAFGYSTSGMNIILSDSATDIHTVESPINGGTYAPDGRNIDPTSSPAAFDNATRQNSGNPLGVFNTQAAEGDWTLFLADMAGGDQSTVVSWGLDITVVPEPVTWAMGIFGALASGVGLVRHYRRRNASPAKKA